MPPRRWPKRALLDPSARRAAHLTLLLIIAVTAALSCLAAGTVLRRMVTDYAASAARDQVVTTVNDIVKDVMAQSQREGERLVELERDGQGNITAANANVAAVNRLAAEVLSRTIRQTEEEPLTVEIPLANLLGSALLMNRGPAITVHVTMLSSSTASYRSELTAAGINQTRHQLFLDLNVQLSFLLPWQGMDTSVQTQILVSETVIVGQVPESFMNWER